jgi:hypothetical protein
MHRSAPDDVVRFGIVGLGTIEDPVVRPDPA